MWPLPGPLSFWVRLVCEDLPGVDTEKATEKTFREYEREKSMRRQHFEG